MSSPLDRLYALRALTGKWMPECIVAWATDLLSEGLDTPNLSILAGLSPQRDAPEVAAYFASTLADLGIPEPDDAEARLRETRALAAAALSGQLNILEVVSRIHSVSVSPLGHPPLLQPWCDLDGGFITEDEGRVIRLNREALAHAASAFAASFLAESLEEQLRVLRTQVSGLTT